MKRRAICFLGLLAAFLLACALTSCNEIHIGHTHQYGTWKTVTEPGCEEPGLESRECLFCGKTDTRMVSPVGHDYGDWETVTEPTCSTCGYRHIICRTCGREVQTQLIEPLGHTFETVTVEPTCTEAGYTRSTCTTCGASVTDQYTLPLGHTMREERIEPTCELPGSVTYTCEVCGESYVALMSLPLGHHFHEDRTYSTCSHVGYTDYTCDCGVSYRSDYEFYSELFESAYCPGAGVIARGLDVSKYNHASGHDGEYLPLDWNAIRAAGFDFVILKAGSTVRDGGKKGGIEPTFLADYEGARQAGLMIGVYFYSYAMTPEGVQADVEMLSEWLAGKRFEYPVYFDMEEESQAAALGRTELTDLCFTFAEALQEKGFYPGIYTNNNWLVNYYDRERLATLLDLWYARYPSSPDPAWNLGLYGTQVGMWQYSMWGKINGFACDFDFDYAYRDYPAIMREWHRNGF